MLRSFHHLWSLFSYRERVHAIVVFALTFAGALLEMIGVGAIPVFIGLLANPERFMAFPWVASMLPKVGITTPRDLVISGGAGLLVLFVLKNAYIAALMDLQGRFVYNRFIALSTRLFDGYLRAPYTFHLQRNTSELLRNTNQETTTLVQFVFVPALLVLTEVLVILCVTALLVFIEPLISVLVFAVLGGSSLLFWKLVRRRTGQLGLVQQQERRWMIQAVNEGLGGIKDVKVLNREAHFSAAYQRSVREYARTARFSKLVGQLPRPFIETMAVAGLLLVGLVFVAQGRPVAAIVPTLTLFGAAVVRLMPSAQRIMTAVSAIKFNHSSLEVVNAELGLTRRDAGSRRRPVAAAIPARREEALVVNRAIELEAVTYTYPGQETPALRGATVRLERDRMIGLVGASGAGKSTLVDVLLGLLEPASGRVLVDGVDIHRADLLRNWQRSIGYIPQSIFLADASIRRNVAFGMDADVISDDAVWAALDAAQLADFVKSLPQGLDTIVGERGVRVSGGQRQRIGIARALYHRPSVLVMDEATSALDNRTERDFVQAIDRLRFGSTVVVVAHRLSTVRNCDYLYVLDKGEVVDCGDYEALQRTSTKFRDVASLAH